MHKPKKKTKSFKTTPRERFLKGFAMIGGGVPSVDDLSDEDYMEYMSLPSVVRRKSRK